MRKVDVNLSRETIKLKIKQLMKPHVIEDKPLLIDFFTNLLMSQTDGVRNLLLAEANELDKMYYPIGTVIQFPFKRCYEYYSARKDKMLESSEEHGIKGDFIQGIIADVYPFSSRYAYTVIYKGLNYSDALEDMLLELESSDVKIYEYD
jgi:hypothetical protein